MKKSMVWLLILLLLAACKPKSSGLTFDYLPTPTPTSIQHVGSGGSYSGVWKQVGMGQVVEVGGNKAQLYYVTAKTCVIVGQAYPIMGDRIGGDAGPLVTTSGDQLVVTFANNGQTMVFRKISVLPEVCAGAEKKINDAPYNFEAFWNAMNEQYPFFALRGVNWKQQYDVNSRTITTASTDIDLKIKFGEMIKPFKDCNLNASPQSGPFPDYEMPDDWKVIRTGLSLNLEKNYLKKDAHWFDTGRILYGKLNDSVGYMYIKFLGVTPQEQSDKALLKEFDDLVQYFRGMKAVVVDARAVNYPGSSIYGRFLAGHFTIQDAPAYQIQTLDDGRLTPAEKVVIQPNSAGVFSGKVFVLTSPAIYGGVEQFVLAMKALPNVTLVGEKTAGCLSEPLSVPLPNGSSFSMPYQVITSLQGKPYEGSGITPDVIVKMTRADWSQGKDPVIEKANDLALGR